MHVNLNFMLNFYFECVYLQKQLDFAIYVKKFFFGIKPYTPPVPFSNWKPFACSTYFNVIVVFIQAYLFITLMWLNESRVSSHISSFFLLITKKVTWLKYHETQQCVCNTLVYKAPLLALGHSSFLTYEYYS